MARDSQQSRVYEAESLAGAAMAVVRIHPRKFECMADVQDYVDRVTESAWFERRCPEIVQCDGWRRSGRETVIPQCRSWVERRLGGSVGRKRLVKIDGVPWLRDKRIRAEARGGYASAALPRQRRIRISSNGMDEMTVIHEIAHVMAVCPEGHGPTFVRVYLDLVNRQLGKSAHAILREAFQDCRVKTRQPRKTAKRRLPAASVGQPWMEADETALRQWVEAQYRERTAHPGLQPVGKHVVGWGEMNQWAGANLGRRIPFFGKGWAKSFRSWYKDMATGAETCPMAAKPGRPK